MKIVYASRTGNVESFVEKLGVEDTLKIETGNETVNEPYVLVTFTDGYGEVPEEVQDFLDNNAEHLVAVAASGDTSYGEAYCLSADEIADTYGVPILAKFEFDGEPEDVEKFLNELNRL
ncbi:MAG: class Ib ribonucleoside-diphosphate reductase assembly flavoprotein NrdI [Bacilli bacterium]|jgi:protein involved in ribonucleotide reduction|nr:class Ib ribonucleoside-diphosphate reductase assembly flavoprotein NrdI [Acholeplasmataceae bacterium]